MSSCLWTDAFPEQYFHLGFSAFDLLFSCLTHTFRSVLKIYIIKITHCSYTRKQCMQQAIINRMGLGAFADKTSTVSQDRLRKFERKILLLWYRSRSADAGIIWTSEAGKQAKPLSREGPYFHWLVPSRRINFLAKCQSRVRKLEEDISFWPWKYFAWEMFIWTLSENNFQYEKDENLRSFQTRKLLLGLLWTVDSLHTR